MKTFIILALLAAPCVGITATNPPIYGLRLDTNSVVSAPTNFFEANAPSIGLALAASAGSSNIATKSAIGMFHISYFGATGGSDDTTAFQSALNSGRPVWVDPSTNYTVGNLFPTNKSCLLGNNSRILFKNGSLSNMFTIATNVTNVTIRGLILDGLNYGDTADSGRGPWMYNANNTVTQAAATNRTGIYMGCQGPNVYIEDLTVMNFSDAGLRVNSGQVAFPSPAWMASNIRNLTFTNCWEGIETTNNAEYVFFSGIQAVVCGRGVALFSGNVYFDNVKLTRNGLAVGIYAGNNNAHGRFTHADFNHNEKATEILDSASGFEFVSIGQLGGGNYGGDNGNFWTNITGIAFIDSTLQAVTIDSGAGNFAGENYIINCRTYGQPSLTLVNAGAATINSWINAFSTAPPYSTNTMANTFANPSNNFVGQFTGSFGGIITNNGTIWHATNATPTLVLPDGSIATVTDGRFYVRSNSAWVLH